MRGAAARKGPAPEAAVRVTGIGGASWEFLYDQRRADYLCLSSDTPLVRYLELSQPIETLSVPAPLRILGMIASPADLPGLDVARERQRVEETTKAVRDEGLMELHWVEGTDLATSAE